MKKSLNIVQSSEVDRFIKEIQTSTIDYFSLGVIKKNQVFAVFSSTRWQDFYLESQCFEFDPIVKSAHSNNDIPVDWHSLSMHRKKDCFIMQSRKSLTGCQEGFSLVTKIDQDSSAILAFGAEKDYSGLLRDYIKYQPYVSSLIEAFKQ